MFQKNKWVLALLLFSLLGLLAFNSCSDSLEGPNTDDEEDDIISALMYLDGIQITTTYSAWPVPENDVPEVDTTRIGFLVKIQSIDGEKNSIRIYGLEGADVGKRENYLYPDCENPDDCKVIGTLAEEELEIDISNNGRSYQAEGKIYQTYDPYIEMTGIYNYQNIIIHYEAEGGLMGG